MTVNSFKDPFSRFTAYYNHPNMKGGATDNRPLTSMDLKNKRSGS